MVSKTRYVIKSAILVALIVVISTQFLTVTQVQAAPIISIGKTVQTVPFESNPTAGTSSGIGTVTNPISNAYDGDWDTQCNFKYGAGDGYLEVSGFNNSAPTPFTIGWVDFKINYKATGTATSDEMYRIIYYVGDFPTVDNTVVLQDWINYEAAKFNYEGAQSTRPWSDQYEPTDFMWDWTDIGNVKVRIETDQVTIDHVQTFNLYEVWLSIYPAPLPPAGISIQPSFVNVSVGEIFFIDVYVVNVAYLFGYQFDLFYNTTILTAREYYSNYPFDGTMPSGIEDDPFGNGTGRVYLAFYTYMGDPVGFTGNLPLARIYFMVDAQGESDLYFDKIKIADVDGNEIIGYDVTEGKFDNRVLPVADFSWTPTEPLEGETVTFNATDSYDPDGTIVSYNWDFGDGQTGTGVITTHVYAEGLDYPQTYPVTLTVIDNQGASNSKTKYITVTKHDVALDFISVEGASLINPLEIDAGEIVQINVDVWNKGYFTETFDITFYYNNTAIDVANLNPLPSVTLDPDQFESLIFNWNTTGMSGGLYIIKGTAGPVSGEIQTDDNTLAGEGYSSSVRFPDSTPPTTLHDYDGLWHAADFTITLSATDDISGVAETYYKINNGPTKTVSADGQPIITTEGADNTLEFWSVDNAANEELPHKILTGIKLDKTDPTADAGADQTVDEDTLVNLNGSASTDENDIASFTWIFTDVTPQTLTGENPTYTFATPGTYTITLNVTDLAGNWATDTVTITVLDVTAPIANAGADRTVKEDIAVTLDGSASTDNVAVATYTWTFTDVTAKTLTGEKPTYTFNTPGIYTITLNVTDAAGNWAIDTVIITVSDATKPVANAGQSQTVNVGAIVYFDAGGSTDNVGIVSYAWDFGDGSTGTGKSTSHTYTSAGTYTVTLTVKDAAGNTATQSITVTVSSAEGIPTWIIGVVIAVITIVAAAALLLRRRK